MAFLLEEPKLVTPVTNAEPVSTTKSNSKMLSTNKGFQRFCCKNMIDPRLVDVKSKSGDDIFYATVWFCPTCHRATC
jgi:hypothetical protein